jgi:flagellar hook-associated protein 2
MPSITSLGIGSGIDLESLVSAYIDSEAIPQELRLQAKEDRLNLELSGVGSFKSSLDSFNSVLKKLTKDNAFNQQITSSNNSSIEVKSNGFASNGTFDIDVTQLAQGTKLNSQTFTDSSQVVGSGTLTFGNGTDSFEVVIDGADNLSMIRDKVNEQAENFGVTANIVNGDSGSFLVFDSQITGEDNALTITTTDSSLEGISTNNVLAQAALDAKINVNGTAVSSSTNQFKNIIEDLTIDVTALTTAGSPAQITVAQDSEAGNELVKEFMDGYNALANSLTGLGAPQQGRLAFDPNVRQVKQALASIAIEGVNGLALGGLSDIGLELNRDGRLEISTFSSDNIASGQERLDNVLETGLSDISELFSDPNGIATKMTELINNYTGSDGVLTQRVETLNERVSDISNEYEALETRLRSYEETLRSQFTFLDGTVSQYNATSTWLTANLASVTPKKD